MADKKREKSRREHERATEAITTAIELNTKKTVTPSPSPDTGTPLPDDPNVLKENVKGLKSQLRRQKLKVLPRLSSLAHEVYAMAAGR